MAEGGGTDGEMEKAEERRGVECESRALCCLKISRVGRGMFGSQDRVGYVWQWG